MRAFLFSGQGSQKVDMAYPLLAKSKVAKKRYEEAADLVGYRLEALTEDELKTTKNTQLAVTIYSVSLWDALPPDTKQEAVLAGFSLGEYSALYASGVVSFPHLIDLILWRSQFMQDVIDNSEALGMAAVLGLSEDQVCAVLQEQEAKEHASSAVYAVNFNSPEQTVISGNKATIDKLKPAFLEAGAGRVLPLRVAGAFHTPFFVEAAKKLRAKASTIDFNSPRLPLYSNVTATQMTTPMSWPAYLETSLISPVYFTKELRQLEMDGVDEIVEVGPGKTLIGLSNKTVPAVKTTHAIDLLA